MVKQDSIFNQLKHKSLDAYTFLADISPTLQIPLRCCLRLTTTSCWLCLNGWTLLHVSTDLSSLGTRVSPERPTALSECTAGGSGPRLSTSLRSGCTRPMSEGWPTQWTGRRLPVSQIVRRLECLVN